jgi:predicted DNA-binding protein (UPF0251 family)
MTQPLRAPKLSSHLGARYHANQGKAKHWLKHESERSLIPHSFTEEPPAHIHFTKEEMANIRLALVKGESAKTLAKKMGVSIGIIWKVQTGAIK